MASYPFWHILVFGIVAAAGMLVGAVLHATLQRRLARRRRRIPKQWPLSPRLLASTQERYLWRWMSRAFHDHHVMVKLPVTRFTLPRSRDQGLHWYQLLSGLYCTFTIVDAAGRVWGCLDPSKRTGSRRQNQLLKKSLLNQCGIVYLVLDPENLPAVTELRKAVLGEAAEMTGDRQHDEAAIAMARHNLRASLQKNREVRESAPAPLSPTSGFNDSQSTSLWQSNSFLTPLDSRKGDLN